MRIERYSPSSVVDALASIPVCISLGGGAWATLSHLGVMQYLQAHYPKATLQEWAFCGHGAGAAFALALCVGMPWETLLDELQGILNEVNRFALGAEAFGLELAGSMVTRILDSLSEEELVGRVRGRFGVSFTALGQCSGLCPFIATDFESAEEVCRAVCGSANVPGLMAPSRTPRLCGMLAFDAGFLPDSRIPALACQRAVYAACVSPYQTDAPQQLWGAPLPEGFEIAVQPEHHVPMWRMLIAPRNDADLEVLRLRGYRSAGRFFGAAGAPPLVISRAAPRSEAVRACVEAAILAAIRAAARERSEALEAAELAAAAMAKRRQWPRRPLIFVALITAVATQLTCHATATVDAASASASAWYATARASAVSASTAASAAASRLVGHATAASGFASAAASRSAYRVLAAAFVAFALVCRLADRASTTAALTSAAASQLASRGSAAAAVATTAAARFGAQATTAIVATAFAAYLAAFVACLAVTAAVGAVASSASSLAAAVASRTIRYAAVASRTIGNAAATVGAAGSRCLVRQPSARCGAGGSPSEAPHASVEAADQASSAVSACVTAALQAVACQSDPCRLRRPTPSSKLPLLDISRISSEGSDPDSPWSCSPSSSVSSSPRRRVSFHSSVETKTSHRSPQSSAVTNMPSCRVVGAVLVTAAAVLTAVLSSLLMDDGLADTFSPARASSVVLLGETNVTEVVSQG